MDSSLRARPDLPCAACRTLHRKCSHDCLLAPYFPSDEAEKFASVHRVFGASNVIKLLLVSGLNSYSVDSWILFKVLDWGAHWVLFSSYLDSSMKSNLVSPPIVSHTLYICSNPWRFFHFIPREMSWWIFDLFAQKSKKIYQEIFLPGFIWVYYWLYACWFYAVWRGSNERSFF